MSKINIETSIKQNNKMQEHYTTNAIIENNKIKYIYNKIINILDINELTLKRKTEEYKLIIDFKNEKIKTESIGHQIDIDIKIVSEKKEQNRITIKYEIIDTKDIFEYKIIWR